MTGHFDKMKFYRRFNCIFLGFIAGSSLFIGGLNVAIDPYGVMNSPRVKGWNWSKPAQSNRSRLFKAIALTRPLQLQTLLLGTSRVAWGLRPNSTALAPYQPGYNSAFPGSTMYEQFSYFKHGILNQENIKLVIIGLDLHMFLYNRSRGDFDTARLGKKRIRLTEALRVNFSLDTIGASWATVNQNRQSPHTIYHYSNGLRNIYAREEQKLSFLEPIVKLAKSKKKFNLSQKALAELQEMQTICEDAGIELKLFITPGHVSHLEALHLAERWPLYEEWKREIVKIMPVWDFSGYNSITTEPIGEQMKNYQDSSHFYPPIGDLILNRLLGYEEEKVPEDFGILITPENVEAHLEKIRRDRAVWLTNNPDSLKLLNQLKEQ